MITAFHGNDDDEAPLPPETERRVKRVATVLITAFLGSALLFVVWPNLKSLIGIRNRLEYRDFRRP